MSLFLRLPRDPRDMIYAHIFYNDDPDSIVDVVEFGYWAPPSKFRAGCTSHTTPLQLPMEQRF